MYKHICIYIYIYIYTIVFSGTHKCGSHMSCVCVNRNRKVEHVRTNERDHMSSEPSEDLRHHVIDLYHLQLNFISGCMVVLPRHY